jgi:hypothetical protein
MFRFPRPLTAALLTLFFALTSLSSAQVSAEANRASVRDLSAVAILDKMYVTHAGSVASALGGVRIEGNVTDPADMSKVLGTFTAKLRGDDFFITITRDGKNTIFRKSQGFATVHSEKFTHRYAQQESTRVTTGIFLPFERWMSYRSANTTVSFSTSPQTMEFPNSPSSTQIQLEIPNIDGKSKAEQVEISVDTKNNRISSVSSKLPTFGEHGSLIPVSFEYEQYETHDGILVPTVITKYIAGRPTVRLKILTISFKNTFSDVELPIERIHQ